MISIVANLVHDLTSTVGDTGTYCDFKILSHCHLYILKFFYPCISHTVCMLVISAVVMTSSSMGCLERKTRQHNTAERQSNTTQLAQGSHFSKKKASSGGTRTHSLAMQRSYQLSCLCVM